MKVGLLVGAALVTAIAQASCDLSGSAQTPATQSGTPAPTESCLLAPADEAKDTRIQITGPDALSGCSAILTVLGTSNWTLAQRQPSGPPAFTIPPADTSTICRGVVGSSAYEVLDHSVLNGTGQSTCTALTASAFPPTS